MLFWNMNIGLIGFLFSLLSGVGDLEHIFTPIMGLSILLAIVVYIIRFLPGGTEVSPGMVKPGAGR